MSSVVESETGASNGGGSRAMWGGELVQGSIAQRGIANRCLYQSRKAGNTDGGWSGGIGDNEASTKRSARGAACPRHAWTTLSGGVIPSSNFSPVLEKNENKSKRKNHQGIYLWWKVSHRFERANCQSATEEKVQDETPLSKPGQLDFSPKILES